MKRGFRAYIQGGRFPFRTDYLSDALQRAITLRLERSACRDDLEKKTHKTVSSR